MSTVQLENSGRGDSFLYFNEWERSDCDGEGFLWETALPYSSLALASPWSSPFSFSGLSYSQTHYQPFKYGRKLTNKNTQNQFKVKLINSQRSLCWCPPNLFYNHLVIFCFEGALWHMEGVDRNQCSCWGEISCYRELWLLYYRELGIIFFPRRW